MEKLNIQDLSKLKITTVKSWAVNFTYDGEQYFLHEDSGEDRCMGIYHKLNGRKSERIGGVITLSNPMDYIRYIYGSNNSRRCFKQHNNTNKFNIVYNRIDKEFFVKNLTLDGLIDSCYKDECIEICEKIRIMEAEIDKLRNEIYSINNQIRELKL